MNELTFFTAEQTKPQKPKCHNCKHASKGFKIGNNTHHQCLHPKHKEPMKNFEISPWDTLQEFWNTCNDHELKEKD